MVAGDYFRTLGIPLVRGRLFDPTDPPRRPRSDAAISAVIDASLAEKYFPGEDPVGRTISQGPDAVIVGVVGSVRDSGLDQAAYPTVYYLYRQYPLFTMSVAVRGGLPAGAVAKLARSAVAALDPQVPLYDVQPLEERVSRSLATRRLAMAVLAGFAALSLLLAVLGVYGVISYGVGQRTREIGIRMALGARPGDVERMVLANGLLLSAVGAVAGTLVFLGLGRVLEALLYGVGPRDPAVLAGGVALLGAVAALASYGPALRASRVLPVVALRGDRGTPPAGKPPEYTALRVRRISLLLAVAILAGCSGSRIQAPPPTPAPPASILPTQAGKASFFFPVAVPLAEVRRIVEASLPPRVSDERKQEISGAIQDDYYRYSLERGPVEAGFAAERLTFSFPVRGSLTVGGRLAGLPVSETVEIGGRVMATASPAVTPDWRPDPRPAAWIALDRADLRIVGPFSLSVRSFLEERLNPILNQELRKAADRLLAGLALRRKAEEAWRSLHVARRAMAGENLWIRFLPLEVSLARVGARDGVLHTGIGISGQISLALGLALGPSAKPPAVALLPPLRIETEKAGGFELEVPVAASRRSCRGGPAGRCGDAFRVSRDRELEITGAGLGVAGTGWSSPWTSGPAAARGR